MTDKEKIRAFVEGRRKENWEKRYNNSGGDLFWDRANEDDEILSFIDSLQEEPILDLLAKYLDHVSHEEAMKTKGAIDRWFAEYYPEPVSEDLEEVAVQYSKSIHSDYINDMFDGHNIYDAVIYGAQWQKQQMMKNAIPYRINDMPGQPPIVLDHYRLYEQGIRGGDKVKLIFIKEE